VQLARDHGALTALPAALNFQSVFAETAAGRFDAARACFTEASEIMAATGNPGIVGAAARPGRGRRALRRGRAG